jgi:hypothetical protein
LIVMIAFDDAKTHSCFPILILAPHGWDAKKRG